MTTTALAIFVIAWLPLSSLAQISSSSSSSSNVKKKKRDPEELETLPVDGKYRTPNLRDVKDNMGARPGRPAPLAPLYRRFPGNEVVVGEAGDSAVLTYDVLTRMVTAKLLTEARFNGLKPDASDDIAVREWERQQRMAEGELLNEWALIKTLAYEARRNGLIVTPQEIDQKIGELSQERLGSDSAKDIAKYNKAVGVEQDELREQIKDGIYIDKYILMQVNRSFTNEKLQAIYTRNPSHYGSLPKVHAWHILRKIDPSVRKGSKEYADMREEFYKISKKAAKSGGKNFEELARQYSDDPLTRDSGGDMGWVDATVTMDPALMTELQGLKPGDVSRMIETPSGFHVIRVTEFQPAKGLTFDDYARQKVIDECVYSYKKEMADRIFASATIRPRMNPNGFRLINEPRGSTHDVPVLVKPRSTPAAAEADVAPPPDEPTASIRPLQARTSPVNASAADQQGIAGRDNLREEPRPAQSGYGVDRSQTAGVAAEPQPADVVATPAPDLVSQPSGVEAAEPAPAPGTPVVRITPARRRGEPSRVLSTPRPTPAAPTPTPGVGVPVNF